MKTQFKFWMRIYLCLFILLLPVKSYTYIFVISHLSQDLSTLQHSCIYYIGGKLYFCSLSGMLLIESAHYISRNLVQLMFYSDFLPPIVASIEKMIPVALHLTHGFKWWPLQHWNQGIQTQVEFDRCLEYDFPLLQQHCSTISLAEYTVFQHSDWGCTFSRNRGSIPSLYLSNDSEKWKA